MPNYKIVYLDANGNLAFEFDASCSDATRAKVLAHAMKDREHKSLEVWQDTALVYRRPNENAHL